MKKRFSKMFAVALVTVPAMATTEARGERGVRGVCGGHRKV